MARNQKSYDNEFKTQTVKLAQEIGGHKAAKELDILDDTIYCWIRAFEEGRPNADEAVRLPMAALFPSDELIELRKHVREQDKEIHRLKEEDEFLEKASAFLVASRRKSAKNRDWCLLQSKLMAARLRAKFFFITESFVFPDRHSINV